MSGSPESGQSQDGINADEFSRHLSAGRTALSGTASRSGGEDFDKALAIRPDNPEALRLRALAYEKDLDCPKGITFCKSALNTLPGDSEILTVLANLLGECGKSTEGITYAEQAVSNAPQKVRAIVCLAFLQDKSGNPATALKTLQSAPSYLQEDENLLLQKAMILRNLGQSSEAAAILQHVLQKHPGLHNARSNFLLFLHDIPGISRDDLYHAHSEYDRLHPIPAATASPAPPEDVIRGERKPVIGFVSSDLREHSVAYFLLPLLQQLHANGYTVHLFDNNPAHDAISEKLQANATSTTPIRGVSTSKVADIIRSISVDILIDLNGHTSGNRLDVFRLRPAPVQVSWLGYPDTTGMACMDFRFVDETTDPSPQADRFASEKLIRLRAPFLCYAPPADAPEVSEPPYTKNGYITFGSFNNFAKTSPQLLQLWTQLLQSVDDSRLVLKSAAFSESEFENLLRRHFSDAGMAPERIILHKRHSDKNLHMQMYNQLDFALDTFPYNGTTTTCEALYMGVPVLTLCGDAHCSRVGASILQSCGLEPLIATSQEDYLQRAIALSNQREDLSMLRRTMRQRLSDCPLSDSAGFMQSFIQACATALQSKWNNV